MRVGQNSLELLLDKGIPSMFTSNFMSSGISCPLFSISTSTSIRPFSTLKWRYFPGGTSIKATFTLLTSRRVRASRGKNSSLANQLADHYLMWDYLDFQTERLSSWSEKFVLELWLTWLYYFFLTILFGCFKKKVIWLLIKYYNWFCCIIYDKRHATQWSISVPSSSTIPSYRACAKVLLPAQQTE